MLQQWVTFVLLLLIVVVVVFRINWREFSWCLWTCSQNKVVCPFASLFSFLSPHSSPSPSFSIHHLFSHHLFSSSLPFPSAPHPPCRSDSRSCLSWHGSGVRDERRGEQRWTGGDVGGNSYGGTQVSKLQPACSCNRGIKQIAVCLLETQ